MDLIVCHVNADFDALASLLAAKKLYPEAEVVMPGVPERNVRDYLTLNRYLLNLRKEKEIDLDKVSRLIIVDTRQPARLGRFQQMLARQDLIIHIYDHHPRGTADIKGEVDVSCTAGATVTCLVEKIREKAISLGPDEATLMIVGIYEDTGYLSFNETSSKDLEMAGFLLSQGAQLNAVTDYINPELSKSQLKLVDKLLHCAKTYYINNVKIVISSIVMEKYCPDLALAAHKIRDLENLNVLFILAEIKNKVYITARSRVPEVNVNEIMRKFGGGGHRWAASASIKNKKLDEVVEELKIVLKEQVKLAPVAKEIMTSPVKTISPEIPIAEARKIMLRYGANCLPVVIASKLTGIITSYDVEKAIHHGFGKLPVKAYMTTQVVTIKPHTSLDEIHEIMLEHDIGHLPVLTGGQIIGMVSRTDLLSLMSYRGLTDAHEFLPVQSTLKIKKVKRLLTNSLPKRVLELLKKIGELAQQKKYTAYVVGGFVRDLLLKVENLDIDIVVEGNGVDFARFLAEKLGGTAKIHEQFATAVIILADGFKIDVATARTEFYEFPAALPKVQSSSIKEDLYRRDFTINAMSIKLNPAEFGQLIDFFSGWSDLKKKKIKVLYNLSFVEDPTRIFRAIRFEQRYHFQMDHDTENFIHKAVTHDLFERLSYERVREEVILILSEDNPWSAVRRLEQFDLLRYIHPGIKLNEAMENTFKQMQENLFLFALPLHEHVVTKWLAYFLIIIDELSLMETEEIIKRFKFNRKIAEVLVKAKTQGKDLLAQIVQSTKIPVKVVYDYFILTPIEILLYLMSKTESSLLKKRTADFLNKLSRVKVAITGDDLTTIGYKPGPRFKEILREVLKARLEGRVKSKEEEIQLVVDKYSKN